MKTMTDEEIRIYIKAAIKAKYRTLKRCAHSKGIDPESVYNMIYTGRLPAWMLAEFGVTKQVVYQVAA